VDWWTSESQRLRKSWNRARYKPRCRVCGAVWTTVEKAKGCERSHGYGHYSVVSGVTALCPLCKQSFTPEFAGQQYCAHDCGHYPPLTLWRALRVDFIN